jgi:hypothetical protein
MIGLHATNEAIFTSTGEIHRDSPYLQWLVSLDTQAIAYDIDAFMASLCKLLDFSREESQELLDKEKYRFLDNNHNDYLIKYFRGLFISIDVNKNFNDHKYINIINGNQNSYIVTHYNEVETTADSLSKAYQAYSLGLELGQVYKWLGLPTDSFVSPVSAFIKKYIEQTNIYIPTADDMPEEVSRLSWEASKGGWVECFTMGHFNEIWDYDQNSAYSFYLSQTPDFRKGEFIQSNKIPNEATYGVCNALLDIKAEFHPFIKKIGTTNYNLNGKYPDTVFLQDLRLLQKYPSLGTFKVIDDGYWWIPKGKQFYPYIGIVNWLNNKKQIANGLQKIVIQRIYSGLYGKSLQSIVKKDKAIFGYYFCPIIGGTVETNSRIQLFEECYKQKITPLDIRIDGIVTDKELPLKLSKKMGEWKLNFKGKCFIINNSLITLDTKDIGQKGEFSLTYGWLINQIKENPKSDTYILHKYAPIKLSQSMNDYAFENLGKVIKFDYSINIGQDFKRDFLKRPKNGQELLDNRYDSVPLLYSFVNQRDSLQTKSSLVTGNF